MLPYILVISILILIILLLFYSKNSNSSYEIDDLKLIPTDSGRPCPICQWPLKKGERVHSVVYRGEPDSIMHIYGCPYCYVDHPKTKYQKESIRLCPACNKKIGDREFVIARLFEKPGKNHVHVLGCHRCRGKR